MQTQVQIRTEFSFRTVYGPIDKVVAKLKQMSTTSAAITDRSSTFGHVLWNKHCLAAGIKPIFGVELAFIADVNVKEKRQQLTWVPLLARNNAGLSEIYSAVEEATTHFHYVPRLPLNKTFSQDVILLRPNKHSFFESSFESGTVYKSDNYMIEARDRPVYEIIMGRSASNRPSPMHILDEWEIKSEMGDDEQPFLLADRLAEECNATLPRAENVKFKTNTTLIQLCIEGARRRKIELNDIYTERLNYEVALIEEKQYVDYFMVIADVITYAKLHMLVGPARGSSCGSLVCYLLGITDIDPIPHTLIFERFIDTNRKDLPDIDIDFQDDKRHLVFEYLADKYGENCVARLGTVSRYKAKSAIGETAKALNIPPWETKDLKNAIIERSSGDSRATFCILDTFDEIETGRLFLKKYPAMKISAEMENHVRHSGMHAAGVVITEQPMINYVAKDIRTNTIQIDKYDAEKINLLKIDALGLRTLTVLADCLAQIGWSNDDLLALPLDEVDAFAILRKNLFCGVFQFEGQALQSVARRIEIDCFSDISAITALARPGPFASGATNEWIARRMGKKRVEHFHPLTENITSETYGLVIYQEQVMRIVREIGDLSWADTSTLRKAMSSSMGLEFFDTFWERFKVGAKSKELDETKSRQIWDQVNTMGSWSFNKSHAVAYGMVSYWCAVLKARFPLQFALATLRHSRDSDAQTRYLRELDRSGQEFKSFDAEQSDKDWSIKNNVLLGGLLNVKGIGSRTADDIIYRRDNLEELLPGQVKKLMEAVTPFDNIFECRTKFARLLAAPHDHGITSHITEIAEIGEETPGRIVVVAKMTDRNLRSLNETMFLVKRNGMKVPNDLWLNMMLEDDTDKIPATISRYDYQRLGLKMVNEYKIGDWFIMKGKVGNRRLFVERYKRIEPESA